MKHLRKILCICLTAAVLMSMVLTANAYSVRNIDLTDVTTGTKTTNASGTTYIYDFKDKDGNAMSTSLLGTGSSKHTLSVNENGFSFKTSSSGIDYLSDKWGQFIVDAYIADPDFVVGTTNAAFSKFILEAGHYYEIEVTWQSSAAGKSMALVRSCNTYLSGSYLNSTSATIAISETATTANTDMVSTFIIDGDSDQYTKAGNISPAGCFVGLTGNTNVTYLFKEIKVTVYDKEAFTAADKQLTVNFDNGLNDIYVPRVDINYAGRIEIAQDPNNSGRGNVLKMTTTKTSGTTFQFGLAATPGLGDYRATNALPGVDGYQVTLGNTYRISYDAYCSDYDEGIAQSYACYLSTEAGIGASGGKDPQTKTNYTNQAISTLQAGAGNGKWIHVEYTIKANSPTFGGTYLLIGLQGTTANDSTAEDAKDYAAVVYFDNIVVTDITDTTSNFVSNAKRSIRADSTDDGAYVSAGIRFRGELPTATAEAAEEIGFIVAPEQYVTAYTGSTAWYDMSAGKPALETAQTVDTTETIYGTNGSNTQYQLLLLGLTKQNETVDLKNTYFTVMMYVKDADGNYTYYNVATSSYREVQNAYIANDQSNDSKY